MNQRIVGTIRKPNASVVNQTSVQQVDDRKLIFGLERYISDMSREMRFIEAQLSQQDNNFLTPRLELIRF